MLALMLVDAQGMAVGKRHIADECYALAKEERLNPKATLVDTKIKKRDEQYICRTCCTIIAECTGNNCFDLCLSPGASHDCVIHDDRCNYSITGKEPGHNKQRLEEAHRYYWEKISREASVRASGRGGRIWVRVRELDVPHAPPMLVR